jgi:alanine dehydrogenase
MRVGVTKEIKDQEHRVALTPAGARTLTEAGHNVVVESGAGAGSGFADAEYTQAGAALGTAEQAWSAELVLKVKEPLATEVGYLRDQILFTYLHLSGVRPELTDALLAAGTTGLAYETVEDARGALPLLAPMSAVAGNMAVVMGSYYLAKFNGGRGMQLGQVLGQGHGEVVVIGDGVVGRHAARTAGAMGARVALFGRHPERGATLEAELPGEVCYLPSAPEAIAEAAARADLLVGGVLLRGARATHVVSEATVRSMQTGSVIADVSIDQGGCVETSRPTSHSDPVYIVHGVTHYCVTNMPGAYPRTSTIALTGATLPYALALADRGLDALRADAGFAKGVNTHAGRVTCEAVAEDLGLRDRYASFEDAAARAG